MISLIVFFSGLITFCSSADLPGDLIKCESNNQNCLKEAVQDAMPKFAKGIRSMGVLGIDPLIVPEMKIPSGNGSIRMLQVYRNSELVGLSKCILKEFKFDVPKNYVTYEFYCKQLIFRGFYEMNGKMLFFQVNGHGPMVIKLDRATGRGRANLKKFSEGNEEYYQLNSSHFALDAEHVSYDFENLIDGNEQLSEMMNIVMNENWREVFDELKESYDIGFKDLIDNIVDTFFKQVPIRKITLP